MAYLPGWLLCLALFWPWPGAWGIPPTLSERLMKEEGLRLQIYRDTRGNWLIGHGRNLTAIGITPSEAAVLLGNDIESAGKRLDERARWWRGLDLCRREAMIDLSFMLGYRLFEFRDMLGHLKARRYEPAAKALGASKLPRQIGGRAKILARQLAGGGCP